MRILVSGSSGRIGSLLVPELEELGNSIIGVDIVGSPLEDFATIDTNKFSDIDCVIHLAATVSVEDCENDPDSAVHNNMYTTKSAIEIAKSNNCPLLFTSTAAVYGKTGKTPTSVYGATKLLSEVAIKESGVPYSILRLFNVITFDKEGGALIPSIQRAIDSSNPIEIQGDGHSTRDFISIYSVIDLVIDIIQGSKFKNDTYDVGSGEEVSVNSVVLMRSKQSRPDIFDMRRRAPALGGLF